MYLLVGTLIWSYLSMIFYSISEMIAWERWEGTIEYTFMAPVSRPTQLVGTTLFAIGYGVFRTLLTLAIVAAFFRLDLSQANLGGAVLLLFAGSVSFVGLGIMAAVLPLLYPERGAQMTNAAAALLLLVSGVYYPIAILPGWLQWIARGSPATYVIDQMRACLLHHASTGSLSLDRLPPHRGGMRRDPRRALRLPARGALREEDGALEAKRLREASGRRLCRGSLVPPGLALLGEPRLGPDLRPAPEVLHMVAGRAAGPVVRDERSELLAGKLVAEAAVLEAPRKGAADEVTVLVELRKAAGAGGFVVRALAAPVATEGRLRIASQSSVSSTRS